MHKSKIVKYAKKDCKISSVMKQMSKSQTYILNNY